jgi:hypothetical protein
MYYSIYYNTPVFNFWQHIWLFWAPKNSKKINIWPKFELVRKIRKHYRKSQTLILIYCASMSNFWEDLDL